MWGNAAAGTLYRGARCRPQALSAQRGQLNRRALIGRARFRIQQVGRHRSQAGPSCSAAVPRVESEERDDVAAKSIWASLPAMLFRRGPQGTRLDESRRMGRKSKGGLPRGCGKLVAGLVERGTAAPNPRRRPVSPSCVCGVRNTLFPSFQLPGSPEPADLARLTAVLVVRWTEESDNRLQLQERSALCGWTPGDPAGAARGVAPTQPIRPRPHRAAPRAAGW